MRTRELLGNAEIEKNEVTKPSTLTQVKEKSKSFFTNPWVIGTSAVVAAVGTTIYFMKRK